MVFCKVDDHDEINDQGLCLRDVWGMYRMLRGVEIFASKIFGFGASKTAQAFELSFLGGTFFIAR